MRLAFLGKGGSGKTTITAGFISYLNSRKIPVLAVDADHNVHLQQTLNIPGDALHLSEYFDEIKEYLRGKRDDLAGTTMIDSTPPSLKSRFIKPSSEDAFIQKFAKRKDYLSLLTVGSYKEEDAGKTCYHGKLGSLSLVLNHLLDSETDVVVADATAGIDTLGSTLYFAYDVTVFVVEPTQKSIDVYLHFEELSKKLKIRTAVIVNKAEDGDESFISKHIPKDKIVGVISRSSAIKQFEQGDTSGLNSFVSENEQAFYNLYTHLMGVEKDWEKYYQDLLVAHSALAGDWYDAYYGQPISKQRDPHFSYMKVL